MFVIRTRKARTTRTTTTTKNNNDATTAVTPRDNDHNEYDSGNDSVYNNNEKCELS